MSALRLLSTLAVLAIFSGCGERWEAYVYPDKDDLSEHRFAGEHESLEACRLAAADLISGLPRGGPRADYECGLNCREKSGMKVCEKTER